MFIRILGGLLALVALLWVVTYFTAGAAMRDAQREPWPYGLGTLEALKEPRPPRVASKEAKEVGRLVDALNLEETSFDDYVDAQTAKGDDAIDAAPAGLDAREAPLVELVRATVSAGDRLVWGGSGAPNDVDDVGELLAADALDHARNGDASGAWERVHAMWLLTRSMTWESSLFDAKAVLRMERAANAVARKLPAPAPAWVAELAAIEPRRDTAAAMQQQTLARVRSMPPLPGPFIIFRPISNFIEASNVRRSRAAAAALTSTPRCRMDTGPIVDAGKAYRAARMEAEVEATAKVLALKSERARLGKWPAELADVTSRCAESRWIYEAKPDGSSMTLRMSWDLAAEPGVKNAPALQFSY